MNFMMLGTFGVFNLECDPVSLKVSGEEKI